MTKKVFIFLALLILFSKSTFAAASSTITAIPPRLELKGNPGDIIKTTLKVRNDSDSSQNYTVFVDDFIVNDLLGTPVPLSENISSKWSLRKWIVAPSYLPVDKNTTQNVPITIRVPSSALPGGHYALVTYMPNGDIKPGELKKTSSIIGQRVGSIIYFTVNGKVKEEANIISFTAPKFTERGPVEFLGKIENASDIHILPKGQITISDFLNNKVASIPVDMGNIFPENIKQFNSVWDQKWGYGRYKAELNLVYGSKNSVLPATIYFWLFPIMLVIYILVALVSVLTVIILLSKKGKRHQDELEKEVRELQKEISQLEKK
jgi:hypothetical protein